MGDFTPPPPPPLGVYVLNGRPHTMVTVAMKTHSFSYTTYIRKHVLLHLIDPDNTSIILNILKLDCRRSTTNKLII